MGKLTYSEQLLINKVKVESKKQKIGKIFIIHNLQEFRTRDQVEDYIKNTLLKCSTFNLNKRTWVTAQKDVYKEEDEKKEVKKEDEKEILKKDEESPINENLEHLENYIKMKN